MVIFGRVDAFHGAGVDAEDGGGGHELSDGDVGLEFGPLDFVLGGHVAGEADHHFAVLSEVAKGASAGVDGGLEEVVDGSFIDIGLRGEDDEVGAVGDLGLAPGVGQELLANFWILDGEEVPGLESKGGGGENEGFGEGIPVFGGDLLGGVELFGGIAPLELSDEV